MTAYICCGNIVLKKINSGGLIIYCIEAYILESDEMDQLDNYIWDIGTKNNPIVIADDEDDVDDLLDYTWSKR